ncbi:unnamed protein product [Paramecium octaurelia]|uniref:Uncharacterized protein n=1 Tax=Paramecium octaurelia TaxID=43137 RepID=A0A8S1SL31_PAROT|nr:unnamed protein product [Paramecium octaurelia]
MENLQNHKSLYNNSQKQLNSQNHQHESMESITEEYLIIMNKFSQEIFQTNNYKEKNEKKSDKLKNIPTFTNLLQRTQLDR